MYAFMIPIYYLNEFYLLGGTYESIQIVHKTRRCRYEQCEIFIGGKTYTGIIRFDKHNAAIVDILKDKEGNDCLEDFWATCESIEKTKSPEVIVKKVGVYFIIEKIIIGMRFALLLSFGYFCYRGLFQPYSVPEYVLGICLIVAVFLFSRPLFIYCKQRK